MRFNENANSFEEILEYFKNREKQLLGSKASLVKIETTEYGAKAQWKYKNKTYYSLFLRPEYRGRGLYQRLVKNEKLNILTVPDCHLEEFLISHKIPHIVLNRFMDTVEYKLIDSYYGNKKAKRSQIYLMNHIDEGLAILDFINASLETKKAFCLHPIIQSDEDLLKNYHKIDWYKVDSKALALALEYRSVANEYLSKRKIKSINEIRLSPLKEVNDMLIADKIQNYKDFIIYHYQKHQRAEELDQYFRNWLKKLKISMVGLSKINKKIR